MSIGVTLLAALAFALHLFATGRVAFPSVRRDAGLMATFDGERTSNSSSDLLDWSFARPAAGENKLPAPQLREAAARHVSRDGRHALIVSSAPLLDQGIDWSSYGRPGFVLLRMPPGTIEVGWEAPPENPPTVGSLIDPRAAVVGVGKLPFRWPAVHVLDEGGYVLVASVSGDAIPGDPAAFALRYDDHGRFLWGRSAKSLHIAAAWDDTFPGAGHHEWLSGLWVDEARGVVVILDDASAFHALSLADGSDLADADEADLTISAMHAGLASERLTACDRALARRWDQTSPAAREAFAEAAVELLLDVPAGGRLFWREQRLLDALRAGDGRGEARSSDGVQPHWDRLRRDGAAADLAALLARDSDPRWKEGWSVMVLPAARWAALHPRPDFDEPLGEFRAAFAADPQSRDGWRDRVLAAVDAALAACGKN